MRRPTVVLALHCILTVAPSSTEDRKSAQHTQIREYWVDPSTGLMWAGKDNGKNVNWHKAVKYCRDLRLAGYADWRLATIDELQGLYDGDAASAMAHAMFGDRNGSAVIAWSVKGNLFLTGREWSSSRELDGRGHPKGGGALLFDPFGGRSEWELLGYYHGLRALCIRRFHE